jgi:hypothetical protein
MGQNTRIVAVVDGATGTVMTRLSTRRGVWRASLVIINVGGELCVLKDRYFTHVDRHITVDEANELVLKHVQMCESHA